MLEKGGSVTFTSLMKKIKQVIKKVELQEDQKDSTHLTELPDLEKGDVVEVYVKGGVIQSIEIAEERRSIEDEEADLVYVTYGTVL